MQRMGRDRLLKLALQYRTKRPRKIKITVEGSKPKVEKTKNILGASRFYFIYLFFANTE